MKTESSSKKRAAADANQAPTAANSFPNRYGKTTVTNDRLQVENAYIRKADLAFRHAGELLNGWCEYGSQGSHLEPDYFPTRELANVAEIVIAATSKGERGQTQISAEFLNDELLRRTFQEAVNGIPFPTTNAGLVKIADWLKEFYVERRTREIGIELSKQIEAGEDWNDLRMELDALTKVSGQSLLERAYRLAFDPDQTPPKDEVCLFIGNEIPVAARGNLTVLQGKSKVGKSAVIAAILGAAQRGNIAAPGDCLQFRWEGVDDGLIVHFDTEQSLFDWHSLVNRGVKRSGLAAVSERLFSIPCVQFSRSERLELLRQFLADLSQGKRQVALVLLDGVADLCKATNDEEEALELVSVIHGLSQKYNCSIVCVLHENPSSDQGKTRGHLGSELNRKAFANLRIDKDELSVSTIYGTDMRKRDLPKEQGFCFAWNDEVGMHTYQGRAAGLKAAQAESKKIIEVRATFEPLWELAGIGTNGAVPTLTPKDLHELEAGQDGTSKPASEEAWKKRMQRAEILGVLRKVDNGKWQLNPAGQSGQERDKRTCLT